MMLFLVLTCSLIFRSRRCCDASPVHLDDDEWLVSTCRGARRPENNLGLHGTEVFSTTNLDACVCVFAKLDQFLPVRSQFDSNQHVHSVRITTFQSANFGPLLFAFYCPLLFYENKIKNE